MSRSEELVKYCLYCVYTLTAISGLVLFGIGVSRIVIIDDFADYIPDDYHSIRIGAILAIPFGIIIANLAAIGCLAVYKEHTILHRLVTGALFLIIIGQIVLGSVVLSDVKDENTLLGNILLEVIRHFVLYEIDDGMRASANILQIRLECCGFYGPESWISIINRIPSSCCESADCTLLNSYEENCTNALFDVFRKSSKMVGITALASAAIEVVALILSGYLIYVWRNKPRTQRW